MVQYCIRSSASGADNEVKDFYIPLALPPKRDRLFKGGICPNSSFGFPTSDFGLPTSDFTPLFPFSYEQNINRKVVAVTALECCTDIGTKRVILILAILLDKERFVENPGCIEFIS